MKLGLSMRITDTKNYVEPRDSIAKDWSFFLSKHLPSIDWIYLPNIGKDIENYIKNWGLEAFILTGGENIGTDKERDITERCILEYGLENGFPVLGICRGMQLIYQYFGGEVEKEGSEFGKNHVATSHDIFFQNQQISVNSYHQNKLTTASLPDNLKIEGTCKLDNSIEAVSGKNMLGLMWHPERKINSPDWNIKIIKDFLLNKTL